MIHLHAPNCRVPSDPLGGPRILDVTYGDGGIWAGQEWRPLIRMDRRALPGVNVVGDFRDLMHVADAQHPEMAVLHLPSAAFDVVVFDPPHAPEGGANSRWASRFGTTDESVQHVPDITHLYPPFLEEARRVLKPNGIILAKLCNVVHRGKMRWQVDRFVRAAEATPGLTACDYKIVPAERSRTLTGHNWENCRHCRRNDVHWLVVRRGSCMRPPELACPHRPDWRRDHA